MKFVQESYARELHRDLTNAFADATPERFSPCFEEADIEVNQMQAHNIIHSLVFVSED